jgi:hypothetical protein
MFQHLQQYPKRVNIRTVISSEMEFLNTIFNQSFWSQTQVFSDSSFCLIFHPRFFVFTQKAADFLAWTRV